MVGFDIRINGKPLYTMAAGDFGRMNAMVMRLKTKTNAGPIHEEIVIFGQGSPSDGEEVVWDRTNLKLGDEVTIRIVETAAASPAKPLVDF